MPGAQAKRPGKGSAMIKNFDEIQQIGKDNVDATIKSFGAVSKGAQAIAVEVADYSKKSFEEGVAHFEKLTNAKSIEAALELQATYVKKAYESYVAEATKIGEMYSDLAKGAYKPYEAPVAKATTPAKPAAAA